MAATKESQQFRELIKRWVDQERAIRLIQQARTWEVQEKRESLAEKSLREAWEFTAEPVIEEVEKTTTIWDTINNIKESPLKSAWEFLTWTEKITSDVIGWGISNIPNIIWNTFWFLADVITPKKFEWLWDAFRESWIRQQSDLQELLGTDPESFATSAWELWTDIWTLFIPWGQAKLVTKFPQAAEKITKLGTAVNNLGQKSPKIFNALKSSLTWAKEVGKFEAVTEWEVTPEGLAVWAIANPLIWKTIQGIGTIGKSVASKLEVMGLLNKSKLNIVAEQLKAKWIENLSVSDYLLKNKIKGTKDAIIKHYYGKAYRWS